uniref:RING-type domain-containing protein n=1 Tax=Ditylenchus dipsaci TaxID=166011 RepID=A0A915EMG2_9BILA
MLFITHRYTNTCKDTEHVGRVFQEVCKLHADAEDFDLQPRYNKTILDCLMQTMNSKLPLVGMRMTVVADEVRRNVEYVTLISDRNFSTHLSSASGFNKDELGVFRIWLKMMFDPAMVEDDTHIGELKMISALNCESGMSTNLMKNLMQKLHERMWIAVDDVREVIRLHTFAMAELSASIQTEFDLPVCELCNHVIFVRRLSHQCGCESHFHVRCLFKILKEDSQVDCPADECELMFTRASLEQYLCEFESNEDAIAYSNPKKRSTSIADIDSSQLSSRVTIFEDSSDQDDASSNSSGENRRNIRKSVTSKQSKDNSNEGGMNLKEMGRTKTSKKMKKNL